MLGFPDAIGVEVVVVVDMLLMDPVGRSDSSTCFMVKRKEKKKKKRKRKRERGREMKEMREQQGSN